MQSAPVVRRALKGKLVDSAQHGDGHGKVSADTLLLLVQVVVVALWTFQR